MSELFHTSVPNINLHLKAIFSEGELDAVATIKSYFSSTRRGAQSVQGSAPLQPPCRAGCRLPGPLRPRHQCEHLAASIPPTSSGRGGVRHLIAHPSVIQFLQQGSLGRYLWSVVGRNLVAVKATMFDKTSSSNWRGEWHQDRSIAIK